MTAKREEKEVQRIAVLFEEECKGGATSSAVKLGIFIDQWFEEYAVVKLKEQTLHGYRSIRKRVKTELGHLRIDKVTTRDVQRFIGKLIKENRSAKSIRNCVSFISTVFGYAIRMKMIRENPCKDVTLPKNNGLRRAMYNREQAQEFLDLLLADKGQHFQFAVCFVLAIYTGFRRGELLGLEWKDFSGDLVSLNRAAYYTSEQGHYTDLPKTQGSLCTQKLPESVVALLEVYRLHQSEYARSLGSKWINTGRLFTAWNGDWIPTDAMGDFLARFCARHDLPHVTLHSFRHLYASLLINAGLDVKTVQAGMRHASAITTLNIYAREFQTAQARISMAIANSLNLRI
jgi:integrase